MKHASSAKLSAKNEAQVRCLQAVVDEIEKFTRQIEALRPTITARDEGYPRAVDLSQWHAEAQAGLVEPRDTSLGPSSLCIFFVRCLLESLCTGGRTEKELKQALTEACRDVGLKITGRGTISGLNVDVTTACAVLR